MTDVCKLNQVLKKDDSTIQTVIYLCVFDSVNSQPRKLNRWIYLISDIFPHEPTTYTK